MKMLMRKGKAKYFVFSSGYWFTAEVNLDTLHFGVLCGRRCMSGIW